MSDPRHAVFSNESDHFVRTSHHPSTRRSLSRLTSALATFGLAAGIVVAGASTASAAPSDDDLGSRFTFAVLPDTQFYSRYSEDQFVPRYGTDPFETQTTWLAENADELRIPFTAHLGDIVDRAGTTREWEAADRAMAVLDDAGLPYSILPGNHDVTNSAVWDNQLDAAREPFTTWFGAQRASGVSTYEGSDATGLSQYHVFEAEGQRFMSLAISWNASDQTIAWAQGVLDAHPDVPVILSTHALINVGADQVSPIETGDSERLWNSLIRSNDQIFMTLNGHFHGATRQVKQNDFGNDVLQVLLDYQMAYEGGNGYLGLFEFDLSNDSISLETVSPWVVAKPQEGLTSYDQPTLEGQHQRFTVTMDFSERFGDFAPGFTAGSPDEPKLTELARSLILDGFEGPEPTTTEAPGNTLDHVSVDGTLAHWRFNQLDGVVDADTVVTDIAGDNDLTRPAPADTNAVDATWEDVVIESGNAHGFSSDGAAVCFDSSTGSRYSYLTTAADAAINEADLSNGYTIETFVKMDADWDASRNGWSKALTRTGNRSQIGVPETRWDWTASPSALGISNLREFQWTSLDADASKGDRVNWSGEIMTDVWQHVAVVNDPATRTTTMYVDGAPVLRNANDVSGMAWHEGHSWILGADWVDDAARNGWFGCIGETRIIDHPTDASQWLTQRADISGLTITRAPEGELPNGTRAVTFAGTGFPGAEVRLAPAEQVAQARVTTADPAVAMQAATAAASTTVAEDGTWLIEVTDGLTSGEHTVALAQALGSRTAEPLTVSFSVAADPVDPEPTPTPTDPTPTDQPTTPSPTASPTGGPTTGSPAPTAGSPSPTRSANPSQTDAHGLASTGAGTAGVIALSGVAILAAGGTLLVLRRRTSSTS